MATMATTFRPSLKNNSIDETVKMAFPYAPQAFIETATKLLNKAQLKTRLEIYKKLLSNSNKDDFLARFYLAVKDGFSLNSILYDKNPLLWQPGEQDEFNNMLVGNDNSSNNDSNDNIDIDLDLPDLLEILESEGVIKKLTLPAPTASQLILNSPDRVATAQIIGLDYNLIVEKYLSEYCSSSKPQPQPAQPQPQPAQPQPQPAQPQPQPAQPQPQPAQPQPQPAQPQPQPAQPQPQPAQPQPQPQPPSDLGDLVRAISESSRINYAPDIDKAIADLQFAIAECDRLDKIILGAVNARLALTGAYEATYQLVKVTDPDKLVGLPAKLPDLPGGGDNKGNKGNGKDSKDSNSKKFMKWLHLGDLLSKYWNNPESYQSLGLPLTDTGTLLYYEKDKAIQKITDAVYALHKNELEEISDQLGADKARDREYNRFLKGYLLVSDPSQVGSLYALLKGHGTWYTESFQIICDQWKQAREKFLSRPISLKIVDGNDPSTSYESYLIHDQSLNWLYQESKK